MHSILTRPFVYVMHVNKKVHQLVGLRETLCQSSQGRWRQYYLQSLAPRNAFARPCIHTHYRLGHGDNDALIMSSVNDKRQNVHTISLRTLLLLTYRTENKRLNHQFLKPNLYRAISNWIRLQLDHAICSGPKAGIAGEVTFPNSDNNNNKKCSPKDYLGIHANKFWSCWFK